MSGSPLFKTLFDSVPNNTSHQPFNLSDVGFDLYTPQATPPIPSPPPVPVEDSCLSEPHASNPLPPLIVPIDGGNQPHFEEERRKLDLRIDTSQDGTTIGTSTITSTSFQLLKFLSAPSSGLSLHAYTRQITFPMRVLRDLSHVSQIVNETSNLAQSPPGEEIDEWVHVE